VYGYDPEINPGRKPVVEYHFPFTIPFPLWESRKIQKGIGYLLFEFISKGASQDDIGDMGFHQFTADEGVVKFACFQYFFNTPSVHSCS
jgi:hypothetical protein